MAREKYFRYPPDWELTQESLKEIMSYCPEIGEFTRKVSTNSTAVAGQTVTGSADKDGYVTVKINRKTYKVHRLVFLYVTGELPKGTVDHIDGDTINNRVDNLRDVTFAENVKNKARYSSNTSGVTGVRYHKHSGKWIAVISNKHLGSYSHKVDAIKARQSAEKELGYHKNHGRV